MELYYTIVSFIFGTVLGSFYNVVGYRLPRGESLISPSSHCTKCNHKLGASELVPIFSYIFQKGRCKNCKEKISPFYMCFELLTGVLFALSYIQFGATIDFVIALCFVSMAIIIIISDYQTMIIPDEVLLVTGIGILILKLISGGWELFLTSLINGIISFVIMYGIKILGDITFKKESMGGGDIKLMFIFGITLGYETAILAIFLASFLALPIAIICMLKNKKLNNDPDVPDSALPFGPFLVISALILLMTHFDFNSLINILIK